MPSSETSVTQSQEAFTQLFKENVVSFFHELDTLFPNHVFISIGKLYVQQCHDQKWTEVLHHVSDFLTDGGDELKQEFQHLLQQQNATAIIEFCKACIRGSFDQQLHELEECWNKLTPEQQENCWSWLELIIQLILHYRKEIKNS